MDGMEGANREHMFTSSLYLKNYREANKITKWQAQNKHTELFFGNASLDLWNSLPQNMVDGKWVQKRIKIDQWKEKNVTKYEEAIPGSSYLEAERIFWG